MDPSSLPETQQQNQDYASQSCDQTQVQSYNQSYYSYYQQHYAYYQQSDYSATYQSVPHQKYHETNTLNRPGVSVSANEAVQIADAGGAQHVQQQQNAYYPELNPAAAAAVAALSQLAQFAGTIQAAERGMGGVHTPVGQFPNKGGYRWGGWPFQGGEHKNFCHRHSNSATSGRSFRGRRRGRGRRGSRHFLAHGALSTSPNHESSAAEGAELADEKADPSADATEKDDQLLSEPLVSATEPEKVEPSQQPTKSAWCELCIVDCTSLQILEQHKNGKRHRKNLLRIEELRKAVKPMVEMQMEQKPIAESKTEVSEQPEFALDGEEKEAAVDVPTETVSDERETEAEHPCNADEKPQVPVNESSNPQEGKPRMDRFDNRRHGMKRKMRGGRGRKRKKTFEGLRQPMEPPKPKVAIPLICNLCNVKCDTKEVFDQHLSGKKHIAKLKRFEGHQAMYGPEWVQALYPTNPLVHTLYGGSQGSYPSLGAYLPSQTHQAVATSAGTDPKFQQYPMVMAETAIQNGGQNAVTMGSETQH